jgi:predicted RNase H-like HicB family nuclease
MRYAVIIENAGRNFSAYVPDLPGCVATGTTVRQVKRRIREAMTLHLEGLREDGIPFPEARTAGDYVEVAA